MRKSILLVLSLFCLFILISIAVWIFVLPSSGKSAINPLQIPASSSDKQKNEAVVVDDLKTSENKSLVRDNKSTVIENRQSTIDVTKKINVAELINSFNGEKQVFKLTASVISTVTGKQGSKLVIDPADLETVDGKPIAGEITLTLKEVSSKAEMLTANTQTISNGRLLESGGMYYVDMIAGNSQLKLKEGKSLAAYFPGIKEKGMEIFYGEKNSNGVMNWTKSEDNQQLVRQEKPANTTRWRFRNYVINVYPESLQFLVESYKGAEIDSWAYDIDNAVRLRITQQIRNAKIYDIISGECFDDWGAGYYLKTENCRIFVSKDVSNHRIH